VNGVLTNFGRELNGEKGRTRRHLGQLMEKNLSAKKREGSYNKDKGGDEWGSCHAEGDKGGRISVRKVGKKGKGGDSHVTSLLGGAPRERRPWGKQAKRQERQDN